MSAMNSEARRQARAEAQRRVRARKRGEDIPKRRPGSPPSDPMERFLAKVDASGDCWLWTGSRYTNGYGQFYFEGGPKPAHRVAYRLLVGAIPEGMTIDHLCRIPLCVNPDHMEPVPLEENVRRATPPRGPYCRHGHEWTPDNTRTLKDGSRACRACQKISNDARVHS